MFNLKARLEEMTTDKENTISITGEITKEPYFNHDNYGENFYQFEVSTERLSGVKDKIPLIISERTCNIDTLKVGQTVKIKGQIRSYNYHAEEHEDDPTSRRKQRLIINVHVIDIAIMEENSGITQSNDAMMIGYICKNPIYRKTPKGREICDILLAVHRPYNSSVATKSDYIPCICWGRNARYIGQMEVGTKIAIVGKLQSRVYNKKISEFETEMRTAYEVSVAQVQEVEETPCNL